MLIAVTRLDEYAVADGGEEGEKGPNLLELIDSIKKTVQDQFKPICEVPDECIVPVSAKGALEARKMIHGASTSKSKDAKLMLIQFEDRVGRENLTTEDLNNCSQVQVLEERYYDDIMYSTVLYIIELGTILYWQLLEFGSIRL